MWERLHALLFSRLRAAGEIEWERAVADSSQVQAKKGAPETGRSPVDRGRPGSKHHLLVDGNGLPLAWRLSAGNRNDILQLIPLLDAVPAVAVVGRPHQRPERVLADRAYDHEHYLVELRRRGIEPVVARRRQPHGSGLGRLRWVVERTFAWLHSFERLLVSYERRAPTCTKPSSPSAAASSASGGCGAFCNSSSKGGRVRGRHVAACPSRCASWLRSAAPMAHRVTLIPGDGTGPELTEATRRVLEATGVELEWDVRQAGVDVMEEAGTPLPGRTLDSVKANGVALKGPITTPIGTGFRSVNVALRHELELYACLRPCRSYAGVRSRYEDVDVVVVRENTEDLYAGIEYEAGTDDAKLVIDTLNALQAKQIATSIGHLRQVDQRRGVRAHRPVRVRVRAGARAPRGRRRDEGEHHEVHGRALPVRLPRGRGRLPGRPARARCSSTR